jgi:hypothetical protein
MLFILLLITASLISFYFDRNRCQKGNAILYFHHFINIFANFGWLSNDRIILITYLLAPIIVLIHWNTNNNKCILTQMHNEICHQHEDKAFDDIFNLLQIKKHNWWNHWGHYVYLGICFAVALYKIIYN